MSIATLIRSSVLDDRWKVFANVREYPQDFIEISRRAGVSPTAAASQLTLLAEDGLVILHSFEADEWILAS